MTLKGGHKPRGGGSGVDPKDQARRVVDTGWDDYIPPLPEEIAVRRTTGPRKPSRDYKKSRSASNGRKVMFALFAAIIGGLVLGGLNFVVKPIVVGRVVDWAAENPTALKLPFVSDIVRGALWSSISQPVNANDASAVVIIIKPDETPAEIGDQLVAAGVTTDTRAFVYEAINKSVTAQFQVGRHVVDRSMTMDQIIVVLTTPPVAAPLVKLVFREGLRLEQMVAKIEYLEANPADPTAPLQMNVNQFYDMVVHPPAEIVGLYPWLKLPTGASLEGFLFPATYEVSPDISPDQLVKMLVDTFASHAPDGLLKLPPDQIYKDVQIASLVETEAKVDTDRALIAGVYTNRLNPKIWPTGLLNADPTLNYANDSVWLASHAIDTWVNYTFWNPVKASGPLIEVVFPGALASYNTYSHGGLMPTPICSPGAASLVATMTPDTADGYLYFLAKNDGSGAHAFAKTQAEQDANAKKYGYGQ
ncbi:MAG TPA: endolytic transglycosylase MltG [Candidatus Limnocylindrales bacterium]